MSRRKPCARSPATTRRSRVPESAEDIEFDSGRLEFSSASSVKSVADFYRSTMKQQGWGAQSSVINNANMVVLNFSKAGKSVSFTIMKMGNKTNVSADGSALKVAAAKPAAADAAPADKTAAADTPSQPATEDDLIAEESGGLPMPKRHTMSEGTKSPFRRELNANVPLDLADVLGFYRRELGKLNWKEESKGAVVAADNARHCLHLARWPGAAQAQPQGRRDHREAHGQKSGRGRPRPASCRRRARPNCLVTNPNDAEAVITINKQTIKVAAGAGTKAPDGADARSAARQI